MYERNINGNRWPAVAWGQATSLPTNWLENRRLWLPSRYHLKPMAPAQPNAETDGRTEALWPKPSGGHHKINCGRKMGTSCHPIGWSGGHISHINHGWERIPSPAVGEGDGSGRSGAGRRGIERRGRSRRGEIQPSRMVATRRYQLVEKSSGARDGP
jgi:hypothetical protein